MVMLHNFLMLKEKINFVMEVIHVDHSLRGNESIKDAEFVSEYCKKHNIAVHVVKINVKEEKLKSKHTIEAGAI